MSDVILEWHRLLAAPVGEATQSEIEAVYSRTFGAVDMHPYGDDALDSARDTLLAYHANKLSFQAAQQAVRTLAEEVAISPPKNGYECGATDEVYTIGA